MFVRKKKNRSGVISVQIIEKKSGKYKYLKTIGSSSDKEIIDSLYKEGKEWIKTRVGQTEIDFVDDREQAAKFIGSIKEINVIGTELLLGKVFKEIGFDKVREPLFKHLVYSRICFPVSKLKTSDYLLKYHSIEIDVDKIYRYLDKINKKYKEQVQQISYDHTVKILNRDISIIFYDVTTLYFEIDDEDNLRKTGFSKEGKHQNPQIVLGLLVSVEGYPLAYEIFEGNMFEGHTMLPVIDAFKAKYNIEKLVIIADSGLLSNDNIEQLKNKGYEFILGARIKSESRAIKNRILKLKLKNGESRVIEKDKQTRIIISYSETRAKKDKANREKGLKKLEKMIKSGKLTKSNINKRGYNKYLILEGETKISIDKLAFEEDSRWDGLKGYITNTQLNKDDIIDNYRHLWRIEKAFRISKTDLKIRPIYHRLRRRIEAHICISFMAYKVYKELERLLKMNKSDLSPEKAIDIAKTIYSIKIITPLNKENVIETVYLNQEQLYLKEMFDL